MSGWISAEWFAGSDIASTVSGGRDTGVSGSAPDIGLAFDVLLRDETGEEIGDESGDPFSLERL